MCLKSFHLSYYFILILVPCLYWTFSSHCLNLLEKNTRKRVGASNMGGSAHLSYTLSGVSAASGLYGYLKGGAKMSLVGGGGLAGMFLLSGVMITQGKDRDGHLVAAGTSAVMMSIMGKRVLKQLTETVGKNEASNPNNPTLPSTVSSTAPKIPTGAIVRKLMPATFLCTLGSLSLIYHAKKAYEWM